LLIFNIRSHWETFVIKSVSKCWLIKAELYKKETNEKSDVAIEETLSQFKESVNHSWSELL
jgi:hypothetical protein